MSLNTPTLSEYNTLARWWRDRYEKLETQCSRYRGALENTLDCLEQNVEDPDTVAIAQIREALND